MNNILLYKYKHIPLRMVASVLNYNKQVFRANPFSRKVLDIYFDNLWKYFPSFVHTWVCIKIGQDRQVCNWYTGITKSMLPQDSGR